MELAAIPASRSRERAAVALFLANLAAVLVLWWLGSGARPQLRLSDQLNAVARVTGLAGTYLVLVQLILRTHVPWLVETFGKEPLRRAHTWNGYLAIGLLVLHGVLQTVGYALDDGKEVLAETAKLMAHYEGVAVAVVSLALLVVLTAACLEQVRHRIAWPTWRALHLTTYVAVALSVPHQIATGADFIDAPLAVAYWWALYVGVVALLAGTRLPALWRSIRSGAAARASVVPAAAALLGAYLILAVRVTPAPIELGLSAEERAAATPGPTPLQVGRAPAASVALSPPQAVGSLRDGKFEGDELDTPYGPAQVEITVVGGRLTEVSWALMPRASRDSINRSIAVLPWLEARSIRAQSANIDVISGATYTGDAYKASLASALRAAGSPDR